MDTLIRFLDELLKVGLDSGFWLLLGLIVSGMIKVWLPAGLMERFLKGDGIKPVVNAAIIGTPLPLCSCSVVPAAMAIKSRGASKASTVSFLISTPENGADSIALSYALLGPFMTIIRPVAAIISAIVAGIMTLIWGDAKDPKALGGASISTCCKSKAPSQNETSQSCCSTSLIEPSDQGSCCTTDASLTKKTDSSCCDSELAKAQRKSFGQQLKAVFTYGLVELVDDIAFWMTVGLVLAALMNTFISEDQIAGWGSGIWVMLLMVVIGIPMYVCATESTPVGASMLMAGVSPGTVLVFLLAGPATNLGTVGIIRQSMGTRTAVCYLIGIIACSIAFGLLTDWIVTSYSFDVKAQAGHTHLLNAWITWPSMVVMGTLMLRSLTKQFMNIVRKK